MDRERQTLELLQLLGDEVSEAVLSRLQPERAEKLRASLNGVKPLKSTISRQREVLDEFECFFQFALRSLPTEPEVPAVPETPSESTVEESSSNAGEGTASESTETPPAAGEITEKAEDSSSPDVSGQTDATAAASDSASSESSDSYSASAARNEGPSQETAESEQPIQSEEQMSANAALTGNPLEDLRTLSSHQIAQALSSEQSRTSAILLSRLPAALAGEVLNLLRGEYQKAVMKELTREQHAPDVLVERIARATFQRAQQLSPEPPDTRDHADRVAEVLRSVPKAGRKNMLAAIEEQDADLAKSLLTKIYRFEDIAALSKSMMQRVLGEIDSTNLTTALYGANQEVTDAVFANLSKRARQTIEEEMQFMSGVQESRIMQARSSIAEIIAKIDMESEG